MADVPQPDPTQWLARHGDYLYRYALMRVRDETVAEDVVQETLLAGWQGYARFAGRGAERTWLTGILKHKVIDYFRKASRETQFDPEAEARLENDDLFRRNDEWDGHFNAQLAPIDWGHNPCRRLGTERIPRRFPALPQRIAGTHRSRLHFARDGRMQKRGNLPDIRRVAQ